METVTLDTGTFTATIYEPFMTPSNAAPGTGVQVGANIKLVFTPKIDRAASQTIRLIQFKLPLNPTVWAVDRNAAFQSPYFGIDNNGNPLELDLSNVRGSDSLKKEKYRSAKGGVTTGKSTREAYLVDPPRENRNLPANANGRLEALFTAYAYDVSNGTWLGGVSWVRREHQRRRGHGEPAQAEPSLQGPSSGTIPSCDSDHGGERGHQLERGRRQQSGSPMVMAAVAFSLIRANEGGRLICS